MGRVKIHAGEIETDSRLVRRLLRHQFPHWADLPIEMVPSYGTDHDIYRLGDQLCARMLFLAELGADDDAYLRGRGWTLFQAITGLYYWDTNPGMIRQASHALAQVLADT